MCGTFWTGWTSGGVILDCRSIRRRSGQALDFILNLKRFAMVFEQVPPLSQSEYQHGQQVAHATGLGMASVGMIL